MKDNAEKTIKPVAWFRSPFSSKFGIPRQSGVVNELEGRIVLAPEFAATEAVRGLEGFDYLWLIWGFSGNDGKWGLTVRPPRLGGNKSVGVFASRSPFRPNGLGLSSARIVSIDLDSPAEPAITVAGADLMDWTPIYDIKPYVRYSDSHPEAASGFTDSTAWKEAEVDFPEALEKEFRRRSGAGDLEVKALVGTLAQRPIPQYIRDQERIYGMPFMGCDIKFRTGEDTVTVTGIETLKDIDSK